MGGKRVRLATLAAGPPAHRRGSTQERRGLNWVSTQRSLRLERRPAVAGHPPQAACRDLLQVQGLLKPCPAQASVRPLHGPTGLHAEDCAWSRVGGPDSETFAEIYYGKIKKSTHGRKAGKRGRTRSRSSSRHWLTEASQPCLPLPPSGAFRCLQAPSGFCFPPTYTLRKWVRHSRVKSGPGSRF